MPIWDSGPVFDGEGTRDPYSQPPKDPVTGVPPSGSCFNPISRSGGQWTVLAVHERRIALPNTGPTIGDYDPVRDSLLAGESE